MDLALQLWSINTELEKDFYGTLKKVAEMGYKGVEFAGYGGNSAQELKVKLEEYGLISVGSHISLERIKDNLKNEIEYNLVIGSKYLTCPRANLKSYADVDNLTDILNNAATESKKYGLQIAYHNHNQEFEKIGEEYILDLLMRNTIDVVFEIDVFWVKYAGLNPVDYIQKCGKKASLIHLKQIDAAKKCVDFSNGIIDMLKVVEASKYAKYFIVEQDRFTLNPLASAKNNLAWMLSGTALIY